MVMYSSYIHSQTPSAVVAKPCAPYEGLYQTKLRKFCQMIRRCNTDTVYVTHCHYWVRMANHHESSWVIVIHDMSHCIILLWLTMHTTSQAISHDLRYCLVMSVHSFTVFPDESQWIVMYYDISQWISCWNLQMVHNRMTLVAVVCTLITLPVKTVSQWHAAQNPVWTCII